MGYLILTPDPQRHPQGSRSHQNYVQSSKNVDNESCHIYFSDDKNAFGVIPRPPKGALGGGDKSCINEKFYLQKLLGIFQ